MTRVEVNVVCIFTLTLMMPTIKGAGNGMFGALRVRFRCCLLFLPSTFNFVKHAVFVMRAKSHAITSLLFFNVFVEWVVVF